eukprot:TRINITY_DN5486_c0_g1_i1.p1 TRINITY_DN5486_c0_g1~~TRINITY_DN5486_c0_g1_i1.p1  ORF type:complete len:553 (+),score=101.24 TRINITY_DN5486_c0_g1_i1:562-2220(+)
MEPTARLSVQPTTNCSSTWGPRPDAPASVQEAYKHLPPMHQAIKEIPEWATEELQQQVFEHPWVYKGEGAAHMVLGYNAEHDDFTSPLRGQVLRMLKRGKEGVVAKKASLDSNKSNVHPNLDVAPLHWFQNASAGPGAADEKQEKKEEELQEYAFATSVITPLLGHDYVFPGTPVRLTEEFVKKLAESIEPKRPGFRKEKSEFDPTALFGFLMPDFTLFPQAQPSKSGEKVPEVATKPIVCVEIKAKGGFMPFSELIRGANVAKKQVCRYCMYQRLKKEKDEIKQISNYCPLDLFSNDKALMRRALNEIFEVPQNNLKLFLDGSLYYTGDLGGKKADEIAKAAAGLDEELAKTGLPPTEGSTKKTLINLLVDIFHSTSLLQNLKHVQMFDYLDVEGVYPIFQKLEALGEKGLHKEWADADVPVSGDDSESRKKYVETLKHPKNDVPSEDELLNAIRDFAISTTVKDCSIMVTMLPEEAARLRATAKLKSIQVDTHEEGKPKEKYAYRIAVVDLDPKQLVNMDYWFKNDQDIVQFCTEHPLRQGAHCLTDTSS